MDSSTGPGTDSAATSSPAMSRESFLGDLAAVLGVETQELTGGSDLIDCGLDSIGTMRLVDQWQGRGIDVRFFDLVDDSTVDGWWHVLEAKMTATT
ncbi:isochorismatase [Pseudonocardia sp. TMWB2A]|uniref:phosphopantetheine-binding protein n=1 Tax=Pseudonocardia sp. TMWB2A TaxID=687430 RepID=UPI00307EE708